LIAGRIESMVSPNTARWQQQINSSFEALVSGALLSPHSADVHQLADCSDWRYAVDDLRGVCPTVDNLRRKDWSLRHLEQRSDSRDSGLESDAAADRHHICNIKKPQVMCCPESRHSLHAEFGLRSSEPFTVDTENCHLCGVVGNKKLSTVRQNGRVDELTNGFSSYPCTPDSSGTAILQQYSTVSPLCNVSRLHRSQSKCFTR